MNRQEIASEKPIILNGGFEKIFKPQGLTNH